MDVETVILRLREATEPSRYLDADIAAVLGWTRDFRSITDPVTGEERSQSFWRDTSGEPAKVPLYTSDLGAAVSLAEMVSSGSRIGYSWETGMGSARIGEGPYAQSISPHLALCIAAMMHLQYHQAHLHR